MAKQTLLEKYRHYEAIIKEREDDYVYATIKDVPNSVFQIWGHGNIKELKVTDVKYHNKKYFGFDKRPNKKLVEEIKAFAELEYTFLPNNIYVHYSTSDCRGTFEYLKLSEYLTSEQAQEKSKAMKDAFNADEKLVNDGTHKRCQRCRKTVLISEIIKDTIIGRSRDAFGRSCLTHEPMIFCSQTCASHEQMSREG